VRGRKMESLKKYDERKTSSSNPHDYALRGGKRGGRQTKGKKQNKAVGSPNSKEKEENLTCTTEKKGWVVWGRSDGEIPGPKGFG